MTIPHRYVCAAALLMFAVVGGVIPTQTVMAQEQKPAELWEDFVHYVRIARPDLAQNAGETLMGMVDDQQLLDIIENSPRASLAIPTMEQARKIASLKPTADKLLQRIENARVERARDPAEIRKNILELMKGRRARAAAIRRLKAAGQFAVPQMLKFLVDDEQKSLHPFLLPAFVAIGRETVYPLSVALPSLTARPQSQIAHVLTELGYPLSIPYFKQVLEDDKSDPAAKGIVEAGFQQLIRSTAISNDTSAGELYHLLGRRHYDAGTRGQDLAGYDNHTKSGIIWKYGNEIGLVPVSVPGPVYADARTRECAEQALALDNSLVQAHSLWLTAAIRGENRLPEGQNDKSYRNLRTPDFHARMAGPQRVHDVLRQGLVDGDTLLARDAIAALRDVAGTNALVNADGVYQPLLTALSYPDRRVRFEAAEALTRARPSETYPQSFRVVPVLAEAVRQTARKYAVVLGRDGDSRNRLAAVVKRLGYTPLPGLTLQDVAEQVNNSPGVDMIIVDLDVSGIEGALNQSAQDYQLSAIPVLALVSRAAAIELTKRYPNERRLAAIQASASRDEETLQKAVAESAASYAGQPMTQKEATAYASLSLDLLRDISLGGGKVYNAGGAEAALIGALNDERDEIVVKASKVLALLNTTEAQQALATASLDPGRLKDVRVQLLESTATSVKNLGNKLTEAQVRNVIKLVKQSDGPLAIAAAELHGALMPPTVNVIDMIVPKP